MRLGRLLILFALVLIVGLGAVIVLLRFVGGGGGGEGEEPTPERADIIEVVIVQQPIPRGTIISEEALGMLAYPRDQAVEGMYTDPAAVVGLRAKFDLEPPIVLTRGMVVEDISALSETGSDAALLIPRGMVAISFPINRFSSVSYGLRRGDHVNVIASMLFIDLDANFQTELPNETAGILSPGDSVLWTIQGGGTEEGGGNINANLVFDPLLNNLTAQVATGGLVSPQGRPEFDPTLDQPFYVVPSEASQRPRLVSQTLLQDVVVLNVGDFPLEEEQVSVQVLEPAQTPEGEAETQAPPQQPPAGEEAAEEAAEPVVEPPDIITLIVSPQDAVTLNYMLYAGAQLNLAMRSSGDDSRIFTEAVTLQFLLDQYSIPVPAKLPYGLEPRVEELAPPALLNDLLESAPPQ